MEEAEKVKALCEKLGEKDLLRTIDSFIILQRELSTKKGEDFVNVAILGFLEGMLVSLRKKYPQNQDIQGLLELIRTKRAELEEKFRKPEIHLFEENMD